MLLLLPLTSLGQNYNKVEITQITTKTIIPLEDQYDIRMQPDFQQGYDYFLTESITLEFARSVEWFAYDNFDVTSTPNSNSHDLSILQMILAYVDMYFTTNDSWFLFASKTEAANLYLDVNNTFIRGEMFISDWKLNAADNFLLVLMYERVAQALEAAGDPQATDFWNNASTTLSSLVNLFYHPASGFVNTTLFLDLATYAVKTGTNHTSGRATGLFTMANYLAKDNSIYYTETKNAVDYFTQNGNQSVTLGSGTGYLYQATIQSGTTSDNIADLQGNLYMATALLQHSSYQKSIDSTATAEAYYGLAEVVETSIFEGFFSASTDLLHTSYDFGSTALSDLAYTYENCMAVTQAIEFFRKRYEVLDASPIVFFYSVIVNSLYDKLFVQPDFFEAGITKSGTLLFADWNVLIRNPMIFNYQAVSMLTKVFPLVTFLAIPSNINLFQPTTMEFYLDFFETTSIFRSSNTSVVYNFIQAISSTSGLNVTHQQNIKLNTTYIDGIKTNDTSVKYLNFTAETGGNKDITISLSHPALEVLSFTHFFYVDKEIRISTDSDITVVQGYDNTLHIEILCVDESGIIIEGADLTITLAGHPVNRTTDDTGKAFVDMSLNDLLSTIGDFPENETEIIIPILIEASKIGYLNNSILREASIVLNRLIPSLSPSPPTVKEGSDLVLALSVSSEIEASVLRPRATIYLGEGQTTAYQDSTGQSEFALPATITISSSDLETDTPLRIVIKADNFPGQDFEFNFMISVTPLRTLERIYNWIETALQSTAVKIVGSLGIVWALLWKQFSLRVLRRIRRCQFCGETSKSKYPMCRYCGELVDDTKLPKKDKPEIEQQPPEPPKPPESPPPPPSYSDQQW